MLAFLEKLFGKPARAAGPTATARRAAERRPNPQRMGARRSLAKMNAKSLAFGNEGDRYTMFHTRSGANIRRLLGTGPSLNVDGTPMVGDTGFDERGKPYGVTEEVG